MLCFFVVYDYIGAGYNELLTKYSCQHRQTYLQGIFGSYLRLASHTVSAHLRITLGDYC